MPAIAIRDLHEYPSPYYQRSCPLLLYATEYAPVFLRSQRKARFTILQLFKIDTHSNSFSAKMTIYLPCLVEMSLLH